ncbi:MAG: hypothetical protein ACRDYX_21775 [Egibacteraceae bacterium]
MLREAGSGVRLALRRWPSVLALATMIGLACLVLSLLLGDVLSQLAVLRGGAQLRDRHAVTFTPYYKRGGVSNVDDATVHTLVSQIRNSEAYAVIVYNVQVDNPDFADGIPTVVLFGDVLLSVFPNLRLCVPAPCAMRGAALASRTINPIDFAGERLDVDAVLPASSTFFDANVAGLPLDRRIVLHLPAEDLLHVNPIEREEALTKAVLLAPDARLVDTFVASAARGGLYLAPHDVAVDQPRRFQDLMIRSAMYVVGLAGFLGLVLSAFASTAAATMRRETPTFTIRRMYGATPWRVSVRVGAFIAATVLALPGSLLLLLLLLLILSGDPVADGAGWVLALVAIIFAVLWITTARRVVAHDPMGR